MNLTFKMTPKIIRVPTRWRLWCGASLVFFSIPACFAQGSNEVIDRIIAIVGDAVILESQVFQNAQNIALQQGMDLLKDQNKFEQLKRDVLREMINQKVLLAKAREDSITVEAREVDRELENRLQAIIQNAGSEQKLEEVYGQSINRIRREYRPLVEEELLVERVKQRRLADITVTRPEIEQYFKDHPEAFKPLKDAAEISHILREVSRSGTAEERAKARADSLYDAIRAGASFDSLTFQFSDDRASAKRYGRIGTTQRGDLLSDYENAAYALKAGEISRPIRSPAGYHIIRLDNRQDEEISTSHILIQVKATQDDEQPIVDSLKIIREAILAGQSFEEAARAYSQDLQTAQRGGYLGWFALEDMPADFRAAVDTLKVGDISQPLKTQYGYHLVKLRTRREAHEVSLEQDWELVAQQTLNAKKEREYLRWMDGLKARYYIEIKDN
jgi:peptidyl-prolyl cis-trans isomerase SurA